MREEIEENGGIKLIYIDPPFDVGADFTIGVDIGDATLHKEPNVLEQLAYRDTWGLGQDSFLSMIYERFVLMRDLLSKDGSIYVHCDWRVVSALRMILDEIFGKENFQREIIWDISVLSGYKTLANNWIRGHDTILFYGKSKAMKFNKIKQPHTKEYLDGFNKTDSDGRKYMVAHKTKRFLEDVVKKGKSIGDVWNNIPSFQQTPTASEKLKYPTQKPEKLLERIIKASSDEGDLVCDFFVGSGTTASVCEKLNRKWICTDIGKFSIHTTRKRILSVQRKKKENSEDYRAFEILNLGKYQKQHFISDGKSIRDDNLKEIQKRKEQEFEKLILNAFGAESVQGFTTFHGKKAFRMVSIGPINQPLSRLHVEEVIKECLKIRLQKLMFLALSMRWDFSQQFKKKQKIKELI